MDYESYYKELDVALFDKIWFLDKVDDETDTILDFGCSNGAIFKLINTVMPRRFTYIGIDQDKKKIEDAKELYKEEENAHFYLDIKDIDIEWKPQNTVLLLSSVLHEIAYYLSEEEAVKLYSNFKELNCRYIVIRDMRFNYKYNYYNMDVTEKRESHKKIYNNILKKYPEKVEEWNSIREKLRPDFLEYNIEFLLSVIHEKNWDRELKEHYFDEWGFYLDNILMHKEDKEYLLITKIPFNIPYLVESWVRDNILTLDDIIFTTHVKMIYKNKNYL